METTRLILTSGFALFIGLAISGLAFYMMKVAKQKDEAQKPFEE